MHVQQDELVLFLKKVHQIRKVSCKGVIVPEEESRQYQINIRGNRFSISSQHGEEHVREVEKFLDSQIREVSEQTDAYGPSSIAMLVALNLADKLLTLQKTVSKYDGIEDDLESLCHRLDKVLEEK